MRLIARRIALYVVTAIVAITINFFLPRLMPGNRALAVLGRAQSAESPQAVAALEVHFGVRSPAGTWGQYTRYWDHLLHANLGTSLNNYPASVGSLIGTALPWTIGLATVLSVGFGVAAGYLGGWWDELETVMATQAPVVPLVYGAAWYEYSTKDYTGWPTAANPYTDPVPNAPYMEYTLLHLTPAS